MSDWTRIKGIIKQGHGVASGKAKDSRFPNGTIALQKPFFQQQGLNLEPYFSGTLNISIFPYQYEIKQAKYTFKNIKWSAAPAEDFSFFDCRIVSNTGELLSGLIYYPHPETKPEHFQSPDILEIIAPPIDGLKYEDEILIDINRQQITITAVARSE